MASLANQPLPLTTYNVACICPMGKELAAVEGMLDEIHDTPSFERDLNAYTLGKIGSYHVVVAVMPETGLSPAATVATQLMIDFPSIRFGLLVGVGGGVPGNVDVRLGDVVVGQPTATFGGVVHFERGKRVVDGLFQRTGSLNKPPSVLSANVRKLESQHRRQGNRLTTLMSEMFERRPRMKAEYSMPTPASDDLFISSYLHQQGETCDRCEPTQKVVRPHRLDMEPVIHYGTIGSAHVVVKDAKVRDELQIKYDILCVEMEAAGLTDFPCLVIRGICDYADSHKNKVWQPYAAAAAAAYMKELLLLIPVKQVKDTNRADQDNSDALTERLLKSLKYQEMYTRISEIRDNEVLTCEWAFETKTNGQAVDAPSHQHEHRLPEWLSNGSGVYLVTGKPGAGKSTFMKFLSQDSRVIDLLKAESPSIGVKILFHSFWALGSQPEQRSRKGLLASLARQILSRDVQLVLRMRDTGYDTRVLEYNDIAQWSIKQLESLLREAFQVSKFKFFILIDGVDEAEAHEIREILEWIKLVLSLFDRKCKICLASRLISELACLDSTYGMKIHHHTVEDIRRYVTKRLKLHSDLLSCEDAVYRLTETLCKKAEGVWIWVYHVLLGLENKFYLEDDLETLFDEVNSLPRGVHDLYRISLQRSRRKFPDYEERRQWLFRHGNHFPLSLFRLGIILDKRTRNDYLENPKRKSHQDLTRFCERTQRQAYELSGCLIETVSDKQAIPSWPMDTHDHPFIVAQEVHEGLRTSNIEMYPRALKEYCRAQPWRMEQTQFIHRSVYEFLLEEDLIETVTSSSVRRSLQESRLACLIENASSFSNVARSLHEYTWPFVDGGLNEADTCVYNSIDKVYTHIADYYLDKIQDDGSHRLLDATQGRWLYHFARLNRDGKEPCSREWLDYWGFLFEHIGKISLSSITVLAKQHSPEWAAYYKGYLALCAISGFFSLSTYTYDRGRLGGYSDLLSHEHDDSQSLDDLLGVLGMLQGLGADFLGRYVSRNDPWHQTQPPAEILRTESCVSRLLAEIFVYLLQLVWSNDQGRISWELVIRAGKFISGYDLRALTTTFLVHGDTYTSLSADLWFEHMHEYRPFLGTSVYHYWRGQTTLVQLKATEVLKLLDDLQRKFASVSLYRADDIHDLWSSFTNLDATTYLMMQDDNSKAYFWTATPDSLKVAYQVALLKNDYDKYRSLGLEIAGLDNDVITVKFMPAVPDVALDVYHNGQFLPILPDRELTAGQWMQVCAIRDYFGYPVNFASSAVTAQEAKKRPRSDSTDDGHALLHSSRSPRGPPFGYSWAADTPSGA